MKMIVLIHELLQEVIFISFVKIEKLFNVYLISMIMELYTK